MRRLMWKDLPVCDVPAEYPSTPEEFLAKYPLWHATAYRDGPPVPTPVAWQVAHLMYEDQPCRSTRAGCSPYMRPKINAKQLSAFGWAPPVGHPGAPVRMNQFQRAQHMQDVALAPHQQEPAELPWLKFCSPQRQVVVPGMQAAGVAPQAVAGGVVMMDVHAGLEGLAGARLGTSLSLSATSPCCTTGVTAAASCPMAVSFPGAISKRAATPAAGPALQALHAHPSSRLPRRPVAVRRQLVAYRAQPPDAVDCNT